MDAQPSSPNQAWTLETRTARRHSATRREGRPSDSPRVTTTDDLGLELGSSETAGEENSDRLFPRNQEPGGLFCDGGS